MEPTHTTTRCTRLPCPACLVPLLQGRPSVAIMTCWWQPCHINGDGAPLWPALILLLICAGVGRVYNINCIVFDRHRRRRCFWLCAFLLEVLLQRLQPERELAAAARTDQQRLVLQGMPVTEHAVRPALLLELQPHMTGLLRHVRAIARTARPETEGCQAAS